MSRRPDNSSGLTLIELLIFVVVVSVAMIGLVTLYTTVARGNADPVIHKQMLAIAEGLMEEVEMQPFTYCDPDDPSATTAALSGGAITGCTTQEAMGPEAGETRTGTPSFDNVNDYAGLNLPAITDIAGNGNANLDFDGYSASIDIFPEALSGIPSAAPAASMNALRIVVSVGNARNKDRVVLESYRTRYAPTFVP